MQIDRRFIWDYEVPEEGFQDEAFQRWYVARVLTRGSLADIHAVGVTTIRQKLSTLVLPARIQKFWEFYFTLLDRAA